MVVVRPKFSHRLRDLGSSGKNHHFHQPAEHQWFSNDSATAGVLVVDSSMCVVDVLYKVAAASDQLMHAVPPLMSRHVQQ